MANKQTANQVNEQSCNNKQWLLGILLPGLFIAPVSLPGHTLENGSFQSFIRLKGAFLDLAAYQSESEGLCQTSSPHGPLVSLVEEPKWPCHLAVPAGLEPRLWSTPVLLTQGEAPKDSHSRGCCITVPSVGFWLEREEGGKWEKVYGKSLPVFSLHIC